MTGSREAVVGDPFAISIIEFLNAARGSEASALEHDDPPARGPESGGDGKARGTGADDAHVRRPEVLDRVIHSAGPRVGGYR
jgi:hypothetical protein